jgi:hypothetical protein
VGAGRFDNGTRLGELEEGRSKGEFVDYGAQNQTDDNLRRVSLVRG